MKISASEPVQRWLVALAPDSKKRVRGALRNLQNGKGDIKSLHGELEGFCRLRVGGLCIVYSQHLEN
jgi:mRNA-degrading endonuclease RelE of RelBE toxin-antitoxin system